MDIAEKNHQFPALRIINFITDSFGIFFALGLTNQALVQIHAKIIENSGTNFSSKT
jgi:hypothetical protein